MKYVLPCLILINCCSLQVSGVLEWTVIRKVTDYGQNVTLFCNVSNCCPKTAGWDRYLPEQRTLIIDLKAGRPKRKYDGKVTGDGYTLIIQNLTKSDLNVSYACVYGATIGEIKDLLEEDVFKYINSTQPIADINSTQPIADINSTQPNVSTGKSKFFEVGVAAVIVGSLVLMSAPFCIYVWGPRPRRRQRYYDHEPLLDRLKETDRLRYIKLMQSAETEKRYFVKILIVGKQSVGKTCLLRNLLKEDITGVKSTDGIDIRRSKINIKNGKWIIEKDIPKETQDGIELHPRPENLIMPSNLMADILNTTSLSNSHSNKYARCRLWDFAGQKEFYCTHQAFLTNCAIYLVVVDMETNIVTKQGKETTEDDRSSFLDLHKEDYVGFWFNSIHSYRTVYRQEGEASMDPPVIVVFTGKDRLNKNELEKRQMYLDNQLRQLCGKEKYQHYRYTFYISNTKDPDTKFEEIRNKIYEIAKEIQLWEKSVPSKWILLEHLIDVNRKNEKHFISFDDMIKMAKHPEIEIFDKGEVSTFLYFQHEVGNIIFFKDIPDLIILEPQWLANAFRCLVSDTFNFDNVKGVSDRDRRQISLDWTRLTTKGVISDLLINTLFKSKGGDYFLTQKKQLLEVMKKFDILLQIEGETAYMMPSMFPSSSLSDVCTKIGIVKDNCERTSWFCMEFEFLPPSFFNHLLVWLMKKYCPSKVISGFALYRSICVVDLESSECTKLLMGMSTDTLALQVVSFTQHKPDLLEVCSSVRKDMRRKIIDIKRRYGIELSFKQLFKCSDQSFLTDGISYEKLKENKNIFCIHHKIPHESAALCSPWGFTITESPQMEKMKKEHRQILKKCSGYIVKNLYSVEMICEYLEVDDILTEEINDEIKDQKESSRQASKLLSILPNRGQKAYDSFIDALNRTENKNVAVYLSLGPTDWPDLSKTITTVQTGDIKQCSRDLFTKICRSRQTYSMTGVKRGQFILISNAQFKLQSSNTNNIEEEDEENIYSDFDQCSINQLFRSMGYDTDGTQVNKTNEEINEFLKEKFSNIDNDTSSMYDSLVITFLSKKYESSTTEIYDRDGEIVPKKDILDIIKSCKHFKGKPKVVIIQTYSVEEAEGACGSKDSATKDIIKKNGPNTDDIFVVSSYQRTETGPWMIGENMSGSYFIQALIHVFKNFAFEKSFMELLQEANRCLVQAGVPDMTTDGHNSGVVLKKTVAQIVLLEFCEEKKLYFFPGYTNSS